jgi:CO/xanthine dehydrogenase FAD-binding subunit
MSNDGCLPPEDLSVAAEWTVDGDASVQSTIDRSDCPPLISEALTRALSWQVRVETPVRRALTSPRVAPPFVAALLALGAEVTLAGDGESSRADLGALLAGEVKGRVGAVHVPVCRGDRRCGHAAVARTPADEPIVAAYAVIEMDGHVVQQARLALTGVWPRPAGLASSARVLIGGSASYEAVADVTSAVAQEVAPSSDYLGSAEYRREMAEVLARRALTQCLPTEGVGQ